MFRNIGFGAVAVLAVGALAIGCGSDGDTIVGGSALQTDNFPGSQIQDNNVADDGRAFTAQGQNQFNSEFEIFWNVTDGNAIAMFQLRSTASGITSDTVLLYGARFNGNTWEAPVQIRGRDLDASPNVFEETDVAANGYKVLWLNTGGSVVPEVAARNGDAVILFTRDDLGPVGQVTSSEDRNRRLWMTYFDRSAANSPAAGTIVRGFNTNAITVDDEVIFTGTLPPNDPSVSTFGFVSDSHSGTHEYGSNVDSVDSGELTSFVNIVYLKQDTTTNGVRYMAKSLLGDVVDNDLTTLLDAEEEIVGGVALVTSESADAGFTTHNELMLWNSTHDPSFDSETVLTATTFDDEGQIDSVRVGNAFTTLNDASDSVSLQGLYGPDHDLAAFYVIYTETGFNADNSPGGSGERDRDADLFVGQINADEALAIESVKIENFVDTTEPTTFPLRPGTNTGVFNVEHRLNRSADFITILYQETSSDVGQVTAGLVQNVNDLLYVTGVQTRRASTLNDVTVRTLADSVFDAGAAGGDALPLQVPSFVASGTNGGTTTENDVGNVDFQIDLVGDIATSQADEDSSEPGCAVQSNAFRVNFIYTQVQDTTGTATDLEDLLVNGIAFTPGVLVDDSPDMDLVDAREVVDTRDTGYSVNFDAVAVDAGDQTRDLTTGAPSAESGRVLVFYSLNDNNPTSDPSDPNTAAFLETRLFVYDQGSNALVSTDGPREFDQVDELVGAVTVPVNEDFTNSRHHAGTTLHLFWLENVNGGPAQRLVTRSYDKSALNDGVTTNDTLETRFTPNLASVATGDDPVQIDQITDGPISNLAFSGNPAVDDFVTARGGSTVGIYFAEDEHLYYTDSDTNALGFDSENGLPAPQLIDNDSPTGSRVLGWTVALPPECNNLPKSMVIFSRDDAGQFSGTSFAPTAIRVYLRVHN